MSEGSKQGLNEGCGLQAFVEKESGPEGAEVPSRAAAGRGEAGVHMNAKHFWKELGGAMGMNLGGFSTQVLHLLSSTPGVGRTHACL